MGTLRKKKYVFLAVALLSVSLASVANAAVYDLTADVTANGGWSSTSPSAGTWSAGTSQSVGSFIPFTEYLGGATVWHTSAYTGNPYNANGNVAGLTPHTYYDAGSVWMAADHRISGTDNVYDPATENYVNYTVIRWTAPTTSAITINAVFDTVSGASTVLTDAWVTKGAAVLFSQLATNPETVISSGLLSTTVNAGDTIDFLIKRSEGQTGDHAALCAMGITITEVPEPMTLSLLGLGGVLCVVRRKK